ncbi:DUF6114 domain-containing protein [Halocatena halophila]|uniref:DUF6114 domain-containing protein n=1 Tax=Halocatena halophila TaxID=2814576 RepID=UPI002ED65697
MSNSNHNSKESRRQRFTDWRQRRPVFGGLLVILGSVPMYYVSILIAKDVIFLRGGSFIIAGLVVASGIFLAGVFTLTRPEYTTILGYVGLVLIVPSLVFTLGGLVIGALFVLLGSNLCLAWESEVVEQHSPRELLTNDDESSDEPSGLLDRWR